jgi:hypothetical protein
MIEQVNAQRPCELDQATGRPDVLQTRRDISGGMIVCKNHLPRIDTQGAGNQRPRGRSYRGSVAGCDPFAGNDAAEPISEDRKQSLELTACKLSSQPISEQVFGRIDAETGTNRPTLDCA